MKEQAPDRIYDRLFGTEEVTRIFSEEELLRAMLRFEAALGSALEQTGVAPAGTADAIASIQSAQFDIPQLAKAARTAGNLCIPFVKALTAQVEMKNPAAAGYVHWGATSQDVQDTATILQAKAAWAVLDGELATLCTSFAGFAAQHRDTVLPGRTWLQQGPPVTFGLKAAGWLDALLRHRERMAEVGKRVFVLQFGGAVGTLAALQEKGPLVAERLAEHLDLQLPAIPWHANRDRLAELGTTLALLAGTFGKIGRDISLMMQTEVGECAESSGNGGSSTMPHKRNPVSAAIMLSAAIRVPSLAATMLNAMVQEHERGLGGWHAEWETLPEIFRLTAGSLHAAVTMASVLQIDEAAMARNIGVLHGATMAEALSFALAKKVGRHRAHTLVEAVSHKALDAKYSLLEAASADGELRNHFTPDELKRILQPEKYLGCSETWINNVLRRSGEDDAGH